VVTLDNNGKPIVSIFENPDHPFYDPNHEETIRTMMAEVAAREAERVEARKARARERARRPWPLPDPFDDVLRDGSGFTATDAAYFLGVSSTTILTMIDGGELAATKSAGGYKIMRTALRELIQARPQRFPRRRFDLDD